MFGRMPEKQAGWPFCAGTTELTLHAGVPGKLARAQRGGGAKTAFRDCA